MMTSQPRILYWQPATMAIMQAAPAWRASGIPACYTIDAGPNVHVLCPQDWAQQVSAKLRQIPGVENVLTAQPGGPARLVE
jgi:diphosphomevalonate decarboxylase